MSPLASYRRLLGLAGPLYVLVAFLGRLPVSMCQLGTLLLVSSSTGSYGVGGLATGALAVGAGVVGYLGVTKANDLESRRTDYGVSRNELDDMKNSARTLFMISDIAGVTDIHNRLSVGNDDLERRTSGL